MPTSLPAEATTIADPLLKWFRAHGRHDLPWQHPRNAYRVWVSEVMLQQTQVTTVIPYFERFVARFPDPEVLAAADLDEVLALWAGLGYYSRGRNLHRAARVICDEFRGELPQTRPELEALPGIGRSTAAAIMALAYGERHAILDGNVKRVLCRVFGVKGWPGERAIEQHLWTLAEAATPATRVADYTQAIMDLGATVCVRGSPRCDVCPLTAPCVARAAGTTAEIPGRRPRRTVPQRHVYMVAMVDANDDSVLVERRPPSGVWGGLWSLPELDDTSELPACLDRAASEPLRTDYLDPIQHTFTHFRLEITPVVVQIRKRPRGVMDSPDRLWYNGTVTGTEDRLGFPAPIARLIETVRRETQRPTDGEMP